jgi:signal transduction histidine kinase
MSNAAVMLRELSLPWSPGERIKSILDRTSRLARLTYSRTYEIWYERARRIEPHEIEQIAEALRIKNERAVKNELHELRTRLARIEATVSRDSDFYRPDADYARDMLRQLGSSHRPLAGK